MAALIKWTALAVLALSVLVLAGLWTAGVMPTLPGVALSEELPLGQIKLPPGFSISLHARAPGARSLCWGGDGVLFISTRAHEVYALKPDGELLTVAQGLTEPNGIAYQDGDLYVADVGRVLRYPGMASRLEDPPQAELITDKLPAEGHHGWRYAAFGPDGMLYIGVGAPCNVCQRPDPFATIIRMDPATGEYQVFARGIRNTVGFAWRPSDGVLWFTENGRDWMGNQEPPDSLHRAPRPGLDFGFPMCHAGVPDPELNPGGDCSQHPTPQLKLPAHGAPLGMRFYTGRMFPPDYQGAIFIAQHGSWNRTPPIGYQVLAVRLEGQQVVAHEAFASGWLQGVSAWGRPVDLAVDREGALLISDDRAGAIYRVTYQKP